MNTAAYIYYRALVFKKRALRYRALFETIYRNKCRRLVEIGTYNGVHAYQMIRTAMNHHSSGEIEYFGFDLFEDLADEQLTNELSKKPPSQATVRARLETTGARIQLFPGDTTETLPQSVGDIGTVDFVFIDGGHSVATIESDWGNVEKMMGEQTNVIFDDYYLNSDPEVDGMGCQSVVAGLDKSQFDVEVLPTENAFKKEWGTLRIKMVRVTRR